MDGAANASEQPRRPLPLVLSLTWPTKDGGAPDRTIVTVADFVGQNRDDLQLVVEVVEVLQRGEIYQGGGAAPEFTIEALDDAAVIEHLAARTVEPPAASEAVDHPDISEIVEVLREAVEAGKAFREAHPDETVLVADDAGVRWRAAFQRMVTLLSEIDAAQEASFS